MIRQVVRDTRKPAGPRPHVPAPANGPGGRPALDDCYAYCEQLARAHHENFPVASSFLPSRLPVDPGQPFLTPELKEIAPGHLVAEFDP